MVELFADDLTSGEVKSGLIGAFAVGIPAAVAGVVAILNARSKNRIEERKARADAAVKTSEEDRRVRGEEDARKNAVIDQQKQLIQAMTDRLEQMEAKDQDRDRRLEQMMAANHACMLREARQELRFNSLVNHCRQVQEDLAAQGIKVAVWKDPSDTGMHSSLPTELHPAEGRKP